MPCADDFSLPNDSYGDNCDDYTVHPPYCDGGEWDTADYIVSERCCVCGGGSNKTINEQIWVDVFKAQDCNIQQYLSETSPSWLTQTREQD